MILTRDGKEVIAIYKQNGDEVDEVKDANGRLVYTNTREITGTLPISFASRGKPLTDYTILGNTLQDGTPTPETPVDVVGCGVWDETHRSYKIPLTIGGAEYPIYLGEAQTTRRIKKLVLTGNESVNKAQYDGLFSTNAIANLCNHEVTYNKGCIINAYKLREKIMARNLLDGEFTTDGNGVLWLRNYDYATANDFKSYLTAEYQNGTPVTVWYVLAEPETAVVNEPLHKIGNYADTITMAQAGVTIPTVSGTNVLDMPSPVKPSDVYIKGKGIKTIT